MKKIGKIFISSLLAMSLANLTACKDEEGAKSDPKNSDTNNSARNYTSAADKLSEFCKNYEPTIESICANEAYELDCSTAEGRDEAAEYLEMIAGSCTKNVMYAINYTIKDIVEYILSKDNLSISDSELDACEDGESFAACEKLFTGSKCNQAWAEYVGCYIDLAKNQTATGENQSASQTASFDFSGCLAKNESLFKACVTVNDFDWALDYCHKNMELGKKACLAEYAGETSIFGYDPDTFCQTSSLPDYFECRYDGLENVTDMFQDLAQPKACAAAYKDYATCVVDNFAAISADPDSEICSDKEDTFDSSCEEKD